MVNQVPGVWCFKPWCLCFICSHVWIFLRLARLLGRWVSLKCVNETFRMESQPVLLRQRDAWNLNTAIDNHDRGIAAETSIGRLFIAGVLPGLLLVSLFMAWSIFATWRQGE